MLNFIRQEVRKLHGYSLSRQNDRIKLNQNESPYDLPEPLKKKVLERLEKMPWNRYPTPFCDVLAEKIALKEKWKKEGVLIAGGSNVLIQALVVSAAVKGKILTVTPSFSLYQIEGALLGNRVVTVALNKDNFSFPRDRFLKKLKELKPQIVFLANPNAPTGNIFGEEDLVAVIKSAKGLVIVDEAYYPYSCFTLAPYLWKFPNLVLLRTFSKAFSLGGVRLGYLIGQPEIVSQIKKIILPFSVGLFSQVVADVVLEEDSYVQSVVTEAIQERELLYDELKKLKNLKVYPSKTNFVLFQSSQSKAIFNQLVKGGILIRDVSSKNLPNALRVSVGTPQENQDFLTAMTKQVAGTF